MQIDKKWNYRMPVFKISVVYYSAIWRPSYCDVSLDLAQLADLGVSQSSAVTMSTPKNKAIAENFSDCN